MAAVPREPLIVGRVSGVYGVRGWVRVYSHTAPPAGILDYDPWYLARDGGWQPFRVAEGRLQGKGLVARLEGIEDRDQARDLLGSDIALDRHQLPGLPAGEYYWVDLIGMEAVSVDGTVLGTVADLMETGSNDVLVVRGERERLIPYLPGDVVREVDRANGRITVDWDPGF